MIVPIVPASNRLGSILLKSLEICIPPVFWGLSSLKNSEELRSSPRSPCQGQKMCEIRNCDERDMIYLLRMRLASSRIGLENMYPFLSTSNLDYIASRQGYCRDAHHGVQIDAGIRRRVPRDIIEEVPLKAEANLRGSFRLARPCVPTRAYQ